jgi:membrane-bound lytic murein transglycosylase D
VIRLLLGSLLLGLEAFALLPLPLNPEPPSIEDPEVNQVTTVDPETIPGYSELFKSSQLRAMELPTFGEQPNAVGYTTGETFTVPPALRHRVDFWKKIYTVYTSNQAFLHDDENLDLVYGVLDLSHITANPKWNKKQQRKEIAKYLKQERAALAKKLRTLHLFQEIPHEMPLELFNLFRKFEHSSDPRKFLLAAKRVRTQIGQRDKIVQGFLFGGRYWNRMAEILSEKGVPKELTRLPLVESAFDLSARSKVGASGVWQFMRSTGKRFLRIDKGIDERNDPIAAAAAAAELLMQNYQALESWPLAITAYNHGRDGMLRAVQKLETRDLAQIIERYESRSFGFASSNFYSEFLAILEVEQEYRQHFGALLVDAPIEYEELVLDEPMKFATIAAKCGISDEDLALLNPAFTPLSLQGKLAIPRSYPVKVPRGKRGQCAGEIPALATPKEENP